MVTGRGLTVHLLHDWPSKSEGADVVTGIKREVFANPDKHTLKEAQDWSDRIYHISQVIYGGGQPSGEARAKLKEALVQRGIFKSGLMRKPVLPLNQEKKDWIAMGLKNSGLPKVDMTQFEK